VAAIERCYLISVDRNSLQQLSAALNTAFDHCIKSGSRTLTLIILINGVRFSNVIELLRDRIASNIGLSVRMYVCRSIEEAAASIRSHGCRDVYSVNRPRDVVQGLATQLSSIELHKLEFKEQ